MEVDNPLNYQVGQTGSYNCYIKTARGIDSVSYTDATISNRLSVAGAILQSTSILGHGLYD